MYSSDFAGGAAGSILPAGTTGGEIGLRIGGSAGKTQAITITPGSNDTLTTLAQSINSQNLGVNASVVIDANGSRLALVSQSTGTPGALALTSNNTSVDFNAPAGGQRRALTIDGLALSTRPTQYSGHFRSDVKSGWHRTTSPIQLTVETSGVGDGRG